MSETRRRFRPVLIVLYTAQTAHASFCARGYTPNEKAAIQAEESRLNKSNVGSEPYHAIGAKFSDGREGRVRMIHYNREIHFAD